MNLLLLDDSELLCQTTKMALSKDHEVFMSHSFDQAVKVMNNEEIDAAIVDIDLGDPEKTGIDFLKFFKRKYPNRAVLMASGTREIQTIVECMKFGADDFIEKPYDAPTLELRLKKVVSTSKKMRVFQRAFDKDKISHSIVGQDEGLLLAKGMVEKAASMRILFYGETGVGKTPFAWYSNQVVNKMAGEPRPLEQINCACLNREQFEDQLYGHKKGAFTGALNDKAGLVELARGGDLFLDEIGEMPLETQAHFLTFLDSMEYYRLGDDKKRKADVRVICATNRDLKKMVEEGTFRKDLYSRISQVVVPIPPLRERVGDIPVLFDHFVEKFCGYAKPYDQEILNVFEKYTWEEGNVRELQDAVEYLCMMSKESDRLEVSHLSDRYRPVHQSLPVSSNGGSVFDSSAALEYGLEAYLEQVERQVLDETLRSRTENLEAMAKKLKVSRPTLYRRLKKYDLATPLH